MGDDDKTSEVSSDVLLNTLLNLPTSDDDQKEEPAADVFPTEEPPVDDTPRPNISLFDVVENEGVPESEASDAPLKEDPPKEEPPKGEPSVKFNPNEKAEDLPSFEEAPPAKKLPAQEFEEKIPTEKRELLPEEQYELDLVRFAGKVDSSFKGVDTKLEEYYDKHHEFVTKALENDPQATFGEHNYEYQEFLRENRPAINSASLQTIERDFRDEKVADKVRKEMQGQIDKLESDRRTDKAEPLVEKRLESFSHTLDTEVVPEDLKKTLDEEGIDAARVKHSVEFSVVDSVLAGVSAHAKELVGIVEGTIGFDANNKIHQNLTTFIENQGQQFWKHGGEHRTQDGKKFLPASKMAEARAAGKEAEFWTFSSDQTLAMMKEEAKRGISKQIAERLEGLEKAGFVRSGNPVVPGTPPQSYATPKLPSGSGPRAEPAKNPPASDNPVTNLLY